jgi:hypothetical protein
MAFYFYQSFVDLGNENPSYPKELDDSNFRQFLLTKTGKTPDVITTLAPALQRKIIKPQHLLHDDPDYYIAIDMLTNTYYQCFRSLLMVDLDFYKNPTSSPDSNPDASLQEKAQPLLDKLSQYCLNHPDLRFSVYTSQNGLHLFLLSQPMHYRQIESLQMMLDLGCDFFYIVYAYLRGWCVRLNRKKRENHSDPLYRYLTDIGTGPTNEYLQKLVQLHLNLTEVFRDVPPCLMYGG